MPEFANFLNLTNYENLPHPEYIAHLKNLSYWENCHRNHEKSSFIFNNYNNVWLTVEPINTTINTTHC